MFCRRSAQLAQALLRTPAAQQTLRSQNAALVCSSSRWFQTTSPVASSQATLAAEPPPVVVVTLDKAPDADSLTPSKVVDLLDKYIIGQADAKRAVAVALRNRWRRHRIASPLKEDIVPKNILMIGPTGCGKTEIARRLAKLADAPFIKVEATKFTEVGFHGKDVDTIIRDLVDIAIVHTKAKMLKRMNEQVNEAVETKICELLGGEGMDKQTMTTLRDLYRKGELDERMVSLDVPAAPGRMQLDQQGGTMQGLQEFIIKIERGMASGAGRREKKSVKVGEARAMIVEQEFDKIINTEMIVKEAISSVEQDGIVFIDEIDKIVVSSDVRDGADASSAGVQRDLLPIIEGSCVSTKHGNVNTDHILFIASGAFHSCKPSDMLAELQGRLPIRVELKGLTQGDLLRILTEPESNMVRQQQALMATEDIDLRFTDAALQFIAEAATEVNRSVDNIGARRLHTILERIVEDISFNAPERSEEYRRSGGEGRFQCVIDKEDVAKSIGDIVKKGDVKKFIL